MNKGYVQSRHADDGYVTQIEMEVANIKQNIVDNVRDLLDKLKSCSMDKDLQRGRRIHSEVMESQESNIYVSTALISMYGKCGSMVEARQVFDTIQRPNLVSWTSLIQGYAENGEGLIALGLFSKMKKSTRECAPNSVTYIAVLKACTSLAVNGGDVPMEKCLQWGREIHSQIYDCHLTLFVKTTLIDMYANFGSMVEARQVFNSINKPNAPAWNALLLGYAEYGEGHVSLELFSRMKASGCPPSAVTYVAALKACGSLAVTKDSTGKRECLERGKALHSEVGCLLNHFIENMLIDMYAKCGSMVDALQVFDCIKKPDVVSWNALILGYAENGNGITSLEFFSRMKGVCAPDSVTYLAAIEACGVLGALALGRKIHSEINDFNTSLVTCLVDFYAKCGSMDEARNVFDSHWKARKVSTWTALLEGYGSFGDTGSFFKLFKSMQDEGIRPDGITFLCLLSCCSHAGLVTKADECFKTMFTLHGIIPAVKHYNCMVDVMCRAKQLNEAIALLQRMPCNPDATTWKTLLGACRIWKNVEAGRLAFQSLVDMAKMNAVAYVLMAELYGSMGMWKEQKRVLELKMKFESRLSK